MGGSGAAIGGWRLAAAAGRSAAPDDACRRDPARRRAVHPAPHPGRRALPAAGAHRPHGRGRPQGRAGRRTCCRTSTTPRSRGQRRRAAPLVAGRGPRRRPGAGRHHRVPGSGAGRGRPRRARRRPVPVRPHHRGRPRAARRAERPRPRRSRPASGWSSPCSADRVGAPTLQLARAGGHRPAPLGASARWPTCSGWPPPGASGWWRSCAWRAHCRDELRERLQAALTARFGHELQLNVIVDPDVLGGVRVTVGDEVVDGTVSTKLAEAHRRLAG